MRCEELQFPSHLRVDKALRLAAPHGECGDAGRESMEVDSDDIDVALRRSPLLIETGLRELFMRNDVTTAEDYSGGDEGNSWEGGIQNSIALEVHLNVGGIVTPGVEDRRLIVDRILPEQIRC